MNEEPNSLEQEAARRLCDVVCAGVGLLILSPVLAMLALLIIALDGRPVLFSQTRVGRRGLPFRIWKFRTMVPGASGSAVTAAGDRRVTRTGARLRRFKLDELPQLINVLKGDMSLIGPRPEVPEYVDWGSPMWQAVLEVRPGITDPATLVYRDEEAILGSSADVETYYRARVLPEKLRINVRYLRTRSFWQDVKLLLLTLCSCLSPGRVGPCLIRNTFMGAGYGQ
jgi:lipopolysaccharide/colanic/teichoic acid biosynthesis glycosyltransferase